MKTTISRYDFDLAYAVIFVITAFTPFLVYVYQM
jgi:hypothetical protein